MNWWLVYWIFGFAYLWFGWHYGNAVIRSAGAGKVPLAPVATGLLALTWPLWLLMRAATKLAQW